MDSEAYWNAMLFIDRLDRRYLNNRRVGWLYVMRNPEFSKPLLKIGMTLRPPFERAEELAGTGVPGHFELVYFVHVWEVKAAEAFVHERLALYRYQANKEFFAASIGRAVSALDEAAAGFPLLLSQRNRGNRNPRSKPLPQAFRWEIRECVHCATKVRIRSLAIPARPKCGVCQNEMKPE